MSTVSDGRGLEERVHRELPHLPEEEACGLVRILARLIEAYQPERIYLFGSKARGDAGPDSDYDIMVLVTESSEPAYRRTKQAYEVLRGIATAVDVLVWTQEEFERDVPVVASLPAAIVREGRLLYGLPRDSKPATSRSAPNERKAELTREWLVKAQRDLAAAELVLRADPALSSVAALHAQQAFEKALKGLLTWRDHPFGKTLDLVPLVRQCEEVDAHFSQWRETARSLNPYALDSRYPGPLLEPSPEQATEALRRARQAVQFVLARLPEARDVKQTSDDRQMVERVREDRGGDAGEPPPDRLGSVAHQSQAVDVGEFADRGLDAVAQGGHRAADGGGQGAPLGAAVRVDHLGAARLLGRRPWPAAETPVEQQADGWVDARQQVVGDGPLVDRVRDQRPGAHEAAAQVGAHAQAEAVEPLPVGGVAAEPGAQPARPAPAVRAAHAAGVFDGQGGRIHLLPPVRRDGTQQALAQGLERAPQPAHPPVELALAGHRREVGDPVPPDFLEERPLAGAGEQVAHQGDREHLRIRAGERPARAGRHGHAAIGEGVIDQHVHMDEQVPERHHGGDGLRGRE